MSNAPTTETPSGASPTTPAAAPEATTSTETPSVAAPEGTTPAEGQEPAAEPTPDPPEERKLTKWSQKLTRREEKLKAERQAFEQQQQQHASQLELAKAFESKKVKPLIEAYARRHGLNFEQAYNALTHEAVNPDQPTVEEVVEQTVAKREEARQKAAQEAHQRNVQAQIHEFAQRADPYVRAKMADHEYLSELEPDLVAKVAIDTVVGNWLKGQEIPLDDVLANMNAYEKSRVEKHLHRLRPGDSQVQANSERENGAGQSAKHEARKRGSPQTLNNSHAAQQATAPSDDDDLSDRALTAKAVKALRGIPGWH